MVSDKEVVALVVDEHNKLNFIKFKLTDFSLPKVEVVREIGGYD